MNRKYMDFVPSNKDGGSRASTVRTTSGDNVSTARMVSGNNTSAARMVGVRAVGVRVGNGGASVGVASVQNMDYGQQRVRSGGARVVATVQRQRAVSNGSVGVRSENNNTMTRRASVKRTTVVKRASGVKRGGRRAEVYTELPGYNDNLMTIDNEMSSFSLNDGSDFGVVQDLSPKFVNTTVEKRPLSSGAISSSTAAEIKSKKVGRKIGRVGKIGKKTTAKIVGAGTGEKAITGKVTGKVTGVGVAHSASAVAANQAKKSKTTYGVPKTPFINQGSVAKRPLSKNVYQKKVQPTKETNHGPVAIITKPEKDSKAGVVVGIIMTIILGAAAGTIAFLLLPK